MLRSFYPMIFDCRTHRSLLLNVFFAVSSLFLGACSGTSNPITSRSIVAGDPAEEGQNEDKSGDTADGNPAKDPTSAEPANGNPPPGVETPLIQVSSPLPPEPTPAAPGSTEPTTGSTESPSETDDTPATPSFSVPITFEERNGIARSGDIVTFGIPIAQSANLTSTASLELNDAGGKPIPAQFTVTNRWGAAPTTATAPIRWLLVDAAVTVPAGGTVIYSIQDFGQAMTPGGHISIVDDADSYTISTKKAVFSVSKMHATLLDLVSVDGEEPISSDLNHGIQLIDRGGKVFFSGKDSQILSTQIERSGPLTTVIRIDGVFKQDFADEFFATPQIQNYIAKYAGWSDVACDPCWMITPCDYNNINVEGFSCARTVDEYMQKIIWPLPTNGIYGPRQIEYSVRLQFFSNQSIVRAWVSFQNHNTCLVYNSGGTACNEDGSLYTVGVEDFSLVFNTALTSPATYSFHAEGAQDVSGQISRSVREYQDSSGKDRWDNFANPQNYGLSVISNTSLGCAVYDDPFGQCQTSFAPRLASYVSFKGYSIDEDDGTGYTQATEGDHAGGIMIVEDANKRVAVGVKDFWQNFPKALEATKLSDTAMAVRVGLFPKEYKSSHFLRAGEKKTHETVLYFGSTAESKSEVDRQLQSYLAPVWPHATPQYYAATRTLDYMTPFIDLEDANYKKWNDSVIDVNITKSTSTQGPFASILSMRDDYNEYGYKEFGGDPPGPAGYEPIVSTDFNKYDFNLGKLKRAFATLGHSTSFSDSANYAATWWDLAGQANMQLADFGLLDTPYSYDKLRRFGHIGHEEHEQPGIFDWLRANMIGQPSIDTFFSVEGLLDGYYTTGLSYFRENALKIAEATLYTVSPSIADPTDPSTMYYASADDWKYVPAYDTGDFNRQVGNAFRILIAAYRDTHDQRYMDAMDFMARLSTDPSHFGWWLGCPCADQTGTIKTWAMSMTLIGLGQYLDLLTENNLQAKPEYITAQQVLTTNAQFITDKIIFWDTGYTMKNTATGAINFILWPTPQWAVPYYWHVNGDTSVDPINGYEHNLAGGYSPFYLMIVDALTYAAKYATSADQRTALMSAADKLYHGSAGYSFDPTWPIGRFSHLGEMHHWTVYGDVYNFYKTYGFSQ